MARPATPVAERLWPKVRKTEGCWLWTGCHTHNGYGQIWLAGRMQMAHRVAYELLVGPIPAGHQLDHICYQPACLKPSHLKVVTQQKNRENLTGPYANNRSSQVRGVTWRADRQRWEVRAKVNGKVHHGGHFDDLADAEEAAIALRNRLMTNNLRDRDKAA